MNRITNRFGSIFKTKSKEELDDVIEDEIISMVNEGHEHGVLLASEATMIQNIFEFGDKDAKDIMVHRKQMVCLDGDMSLGEALEVVRTSTFSRYPVYLQDLDHMIGVLHIKDALAYALDQTCYGRKLRDFDELLQPAEFVPETHSLNTLFAKMQSKKNHMMIVVDEYGQTSGLISMEDILEEIVGNIQDEHDDEEISIEQLSQDHYSMTGATTLEEASDVLGITFPEEFETLNGFLISLLGRIPDEKESFTADYESYRFHILDVEGKIIQQVDVECLPQPVENSHDTNLESADEK
ncbi:MAG: hemolysin family protein [Lachnospiraceae bacterium]|nr:hemolysin family protein [Lachnospiraceae bacterium]